jgi:hypothetical protein
MAGLERPLNLRLSEIEHKKVAKLAAASGVTVSEFVRKLLAAASDPKQRAPADAGLAALVAERDELLKSHEIVDRHVDRLLRVVIAIRDELDGRYDGAPDSTNRWMGSHLRDLDAALAATRSPKT